MKTKATKILLLALSVLMMFGLVIGFGASAEEIENTATIAQPKIASYSVYYADEIYLYYALNNSEVAEGAEIELLLYIENPAENAEATVYNATLSAREYTPNPAYPVYRSFGIPAKAIGDTIYAVPHVVGSEITYDNMVSYSVAEYLWEMNYTVTPTEQQTKLYNALLDYGIAAQEYFNYNTDKYLLSNLAYVYVDGGTLDGTSDRAIFDISADIATRTITPVIAGVANLNVTSYAADGTATTTKIASGTSIEVTGHTIVVSADQILTVNDRRAEDGDALTNTNIMTLDFTVSYSQVALGMHMNLFELLDEDGNVINKFDLYAQNYSGEARIRVWNDTCTYLSGANVSNRSV